MTHLLMVMYIVYQIPGIGCGMSYHDISVDGDVYQIPGIGCGMSYHDVSVDGDGQDVEDGHGQQTVSQQREQLNVKCKNNFYRSVEQLFVSQLPLSI